MLDEIFDKVVNTKRLVDGDGNLETYEANLIGVSCYIQVLDSAYSEDIDGSAGKEFLMFCLICDIKEGDIIVDGTDEYRVVGIEEYNVACQDEHMEIVIRLYNP